MRFACFALSLLAVSARLAAQALPDSSGSPGSPDAHDAGKTLPAVTVTVNKQSQPLDAVAAGVTAFAGEELANEGVRDLQGVAQMTPGLTFQPVGQSSPRACSRSVRGRKSTDSGGLRRCKSSPGHKARLRFAPCSPSRSALLHLTTRP